MPVLKDFIKIWSKWVSFGSLQFKIQPHFNGELFSRVKGQDIVSGTFCATVWRIHNWFVPWKIFNKILIQISFHCQFSYVANKWSFLRQVNLINSIYTFDNVVMKSILGILRALNIEQSFVIGIILGKQEFWFFVMLIFVYLPIKRTWGKKTMQIQFTGNLFEKCE